jgi:serine/threonine protein phosphatase PrpC
MIESFGATDIGCVRERNEDRILIDTALGLFIVADGMGGHSHGALAAELAISTMHNYLESSQDRLDITWPFGYDFNLSSDANRLVTAAQLANRQVWRQSEQAPEYTGMGTTIAAVIAADEQITIGNVGDSRVYFWHDGLMRQITVDDTWMQAIAGRGLQIDKSKHPLRNFLTQSAGSKELIEVHIAELAPVSGDMVLICSDGLHGMVSESEIAAAIGAQRPLEVIGSNLIRMAREAGGSDNISVILMAVK